MKSDEPIRNRVPRLQVFAAASLLLVVACAGTSMGQSAVRSPGPSQPTTKADSKTVTRRHRGKKQSASPESPASLSSQAANPPEVSLDHGTLKVDARNSELSAILQDVAQKSGMNVDGLSRNTRVFGVYGPGSPRDVLSQLLTGAGYNFVMVGGGNGNVPRELVLTAQSSNALPLNPGRPAPSQPAPDSGDNSEDNDQEPLGPGAIAHPSPQATEQTDDQTRMQRHLETLRHMQETIQQQQQQRQQQQQNQPQ